MFRAIFYQITLTTTHPATDTHHLHGKAFRWYDGKSAFCTRTYRYGNPGPIRMDDDESANEQSPESFLITSVLLELGLGVVAVVLGLTLGPDPRDVLPFANQWQQILFGLGLGILAAVPMLGAVQLIELLPLAPIRDLQRVTEERLLGAMSKMRTIDLLTVSICAGVGEELLFRGWLMMSLSGPMAQWTTPLLFSAVVISSIAFGLAHPITPAYVVITGSIGLYLAMLLVWSGNLLVPIAAHAFYDFIQLVLATRAQRSKSADDESR